jgi:hypothetical protein
MDKPAKIANIIFQNLTDPILVYDFADYFYTGEIPKSYHCFLEDTEKSENEILDLINIYGEFRNERNTIYTIKIENEMINFELSDRLIKSRNIIEKTDAKLKKYSKVHICEMRGCKKSCKKHEH